MKLFLLFAASTAAIAAAVTRDIGTGHLWHATSILWAFRWLLCEWWPSYRKETI